MPQVRSPFSLFSMPLALAFSQFYPATLHWADRRPIGYLVLATAASGWSKNPRGWLMDPALDVTSAAGRKAFRTRLLAWADRSVALLKRAHAQGMVTWDIEGELFPHPTTYVGDPRLATRLAPEMTGVIDEYFARFRAAGLRVGVTVRPQDASFSRDGRTLSQRPTEFASEELIAKIGYARERWGASLFYIDSNGDRALPLSFAALRRVAERFPDVLLIPEHATLPYYSASAPYRDLHTAQHSLRSFVRQAWPEAFEVANLADVSPETQAAAIRAAASDGDIPLFRAWFEEPVIDRLAAVYAHETCAAATLGPK